MATSSDEMTKLSWRRFEDGDNVWDDLTEQIFVQDTSHKCPTYVHKTPPCQGSCPSGEDIRGWLQIVRGLEQPPEGMTWQEYAFRRSTDANPFPSMMGRVCPAPCQDGCNRNELEDFVGINAVEQFIGDTAITNGYKFDAPPADTGKRVAIIGGGPAGWPRPTSCAARVTRRPSSRPTTAWAACSASASRAIACRATSSTPRSTASSTWVRSRSS
jgi:glutamate synthase (NADPH/NADH) small chain